MKHLGHLFCVLLAVLGLVPLALHAQTDVAASVYGAFGSTTSGTATMRDPSGDTTQSPSNAAGFLLEVRHIVSPFVGFEGTYSYNRANRAYSNVSNSPIGCGPGVASCPPSTVMTTVAIPANSHEITGDWVFSMKLANLRPFALVGGGILLDVPAEGSAAGTTTTVTCAPHSNLCQAVPAPSSFATQTQTTGVFVYGAGLDWTLLPHLGLRFQYRGNLYKAPNMVQVFTSLNSFTHTAEPMVGVFFRF